MSVVIGQLQVDADAEAAGTKATAPAAPRPSTSTAAAMSPATRLQALNLLRHQRERLARVRSC